MAPVQEAAVPLEEAVAVFPTFNCSVSELARPIGAELDSTVTVELPAVVWAAAHAAHCASPGVAYGDEMGGVTRPRGS